MPHSQAGSKNVQVMKYQNTASKSSKLVSLIGNANELLTTKNITYTSSQQNKPYK